MERALRCMLAVMSMRPPVALHRHCYKQRTLPALLEARWRWCGANGRCDGARSTGRL